MLGLGLRVPAGDEKVRYLILYLSRTILNVRDCERDFANKTFEYGNIFDTVGQGKFVVVYPHSVLSLRR